MNNDNRNHETQDTYNKFFERKSVKKELVFVDPDQDIERYVILLDVIDKNHPQFDRVVNLVTYYLRKQKYAMTDEDFKAIIKNEKENNDFHFWV